MPSSASAEGSSEEGLDFLEAGLYLQSWSGSNSKRVKIYP